MWHYSIILFSKMVDKGYDENIQRVFISFPWSVFSYIDTSLYAVLCMQVQYVCIINSDLYVCSTLYFTVYVFEMCTSSNFFLSIEWLKLDLLFLNISYQCVCVLECVKNSATQYAINDFFVTNKSLLYNSMNPI